jgi:hypothetical protein
MAWWSISDKTLGKVLRIGVFVVLPLALLTSLYSCGMAYQATHKPAPDVQREVTINNNIRFFVTNFLTLYFGGYGDGDKKALQAMVLNDVPISLSDQPMTADYINIDDVKTLASGQDKGLYEVAANITLTAPGSQSTTRNHYTLEVVRAGTAYAVARLPELAEYQTPSVSAMSKLVAEMSPDSDLGLAITSFATAYYVSSNSDALGRYVTSNFPTGSIKNSPYTGVQVMSIKAPKQLDGPGRPDKHENVTVLVTLKGVVTTTTFNLMQVLLNVQISDNDRWVVDGISRRMPIENITEHTENNPGPTTQPTAGPPDTPTLSDTAEATAPSTTESSTPGEDGDNTTSTTGVVPSTGR